VIAIENVRLFKELADKSRQLEVASQHKSEFLANMSHELRTPLNAVIGFSEVLGERMFGELNDKQAEYIRDINASGNHLLSLINDILDLSKIEAGRMELELADFHLPQAIENALVLVRERALRHGLTLEQSIDPRLREMRGDERKIKQVLLNLLSNAIKFTPEGGRVSVQGSAGGRARGGGGQRHGRGHLSGAPGGGIRGVSAGGDRGEEGRGDRSRTCPGPKVHRAARGPDPGPEPGRCRFDIYLHTPGAPWRLRWSAAASC
jgi:hypothetical protein